MRESLENIGMTHKECSDQRHQAWQATNPNLKIKKGDYVKKAFEEVRNGKPAYEHMWVKVQSVRGKTIKGVLNNDPFIVDMKCGDKVTMKYSEIKDHIE